MKKRSFGVLLTGALVFVLSLAVVASASAVPSLTSIQPTGGTASTPGSYQLKIFGQNFAEFIGTPTVYLEQSVWPYDEIPATNVTVVPMLGGDYISCFINTYQETAGAYDVVVSGYWLLGQVTPANLTLAGAFTVTGALPSSTPTIASIRPKSATAGGAAFTLTVNGANFATGLVNPAVVYWNSIPLTTTPGTLPNPTAVCTAAVPAALIATPGVAMITVVNPAGVGTVSNAVPFAINAALPTLTAVSPTSTWAQFITPPLVTLTGTNFQSGAQVLVNGAVHAATYVNATSITVQLTAADIASAGTLNFAVRNGPSGTPTSTLPFNVNAETSLPVVTISGADNLWHNQAVVLTVSATDSQSGVQKIMYGVGATPVWTLLSGTTITVPGPQGGVTNGTNVVSAYAVDNCNASSTPPAQVSVNICTSGPDTEAFAPSSVKKGKTCKISYVCNSITPQCSDIKIKIYNSSGVVKKSVNGGTKTSNQKYSIQFTCNLSPGKYKVRVYANDAAGNPQDSMDTDSFQVTK